MTGWERAAIAYCLESNKNISITAGVYEHDPQSGKLVHKEVMSIQEMDRLMQSEDFRTGWKLCLERVAEILQFISDPTTTTHDIKRYIPVKHRPAKPKKGTSRGTR